jgi:hypothetical protein
MMKKKRFLSKYMLILGGVALFSGCSGIARQRPKIEIPVPVKRPHEKQKTQQPSPSVSGSTQQLFIRGQRAYYRGEYEEALKNFHAAAESDSNFLEPRVGIPTFWNHVWDWEKFSWISGSMRKQSKPSPL